MSGDALRVLIADDQRVVRDGLVMLLGLLPGVEVVGSAGDGEEALRLAGELRPEVVLMDLRMPRLDGVEATRRIRAELPDVQVVVLTTYADDASLFPALRAGARGYLTKDAEAEEIARALAAVRDGGAGLDPRIQARLLTAVAGDAASSPEPGGHRDDTAAEDTAGAGAPPDGLTRREVEVLALIADGLSNREIARRLVVGEATVKTHINNLFAKAALRDRAQAVRYAYHHGIARPR